MPWDASIHTSFAFESVPVQVRNKVNEIGLDEGRGGTGNSTIESNNYQHWRAGNYRIFGSWARGAGRFNFVAYGTHTGRGNQAYSILLYNGRTHRVTTD